ncbi:hypothetical protein SAMN05880501_10723 [Ureibacillus xyleni]|uniref:Uncharacterized protein n=1 Tax=Ureibacillus xyleni TaxID=614648 RepID=A0A285SW98_9BACL|nr:hypothetical protein [Ureibacillus xyleni]SOC12585.1 hypothetical protein SAMN05880501_10723 [Ureibacillus xyleni]
MHNIFMLIPVAFPEDKTELIPAFIELLLVIALCGVALVVIKRISKKQELKTKALEEHILRERQKSAQSNTEQ